MPFQTGMSAGVAVDASVVDHRVHSAELVDLIRQRTGLLQAGKIAHDDVGPMVGEIGRGGDPLVAASVDDHGVPVGEQLGGG